MTIYIARTCAICGYRIRLNKNQAFDKHYNKDKSFCEGSYKTPEQVKTIHVPIFKK